MPRKKKSAPIEPIQNDIRIVLEYTPENDAVKTHWAYRVEQFEQRYGWGNSIITQWELLAAFHASTEDAAETALANAEFCAKLLAKSLDSPPCTSSSETRILAEYRRPR